MTDINNFIEMIERCGLECTRHSPGRWRGKINRLGMVDLEVADEVTVYGHFYDELSAYFDAEGNLITMESHVVFGAPTGRVEELLARSKE